MSGTNTIKHHLRDGMSVSCRDFFERRPVSVDGELSQEPCDEIRTRMDGCDPCGNFAKSLKTTAELCRRLPAQPIPPEAAADLRNLIGVWLQSASATQGARFAVDASRRVFPTATAASISAWANAHQGQMPTRLSAGN
jgi:hypothetical protein